MNDIKAEELLRKHLGKKNLTNEHIHIAAFMSCIDAINEALNIAFVSKQSEPLRFLIEKFQTPKGNYLIDLLMEREKEQKT